MDPSSTCQKLISDPPTRSGVMILAGVARSVDKVANVALSLAFLHATARQLPAVGNLQRDKATAKPVSEICDTLSYCFANCTAQQIAESNIVSILWSLHEKERHLTSVHAAFLDAAIGAKQYQAAEQHVLDAWPTPDHTTLRAKDVLRYYYLRGILHMGCHNWTMAIRCFTTCICFPSKNVVSAISVAAWKKYVLLQCLVKGDCVSFTAKILHDNMASPLQRLLQDASNSSRFQKASSSSAESVVEMSDRDIVMKEPSVLDVLSAYMKLVYAFAETDRGVFDTIATGASSQTIFAADGTAGLVQRVDAILLRRQLYNIGGVFSAITTQQLANELSLPMDRLPLLLAQVRDERQWNVSMEGEYVVFPGHGPRLESKVVLDQARGEVENMRKLLLNANESLLNSNKGLKASLHSLAHHRHHPDGGEIEL